MKDMYGYEKPTVQAKIAEAAAELGLTVDDSGRVIDSVGKVLIEANYPNMALNTLLGWKRRGNTPGTPGVRPPSKPKPKKPRGDGFGRDRTPKDAA